MLKHKLLSFSLNLNWFFTAFPPFPQLTALGILESLISFQIGPRSTLSAPSTPLPAMELQDVVPSQLGTVMVTAVFASSLLCKCFLPTPPPQHSQYGPLILRPIFQLYYSLAKRLENEMDTHASILAWRILCTEELGGLQSTGSRRVGHDWMTATHWKDLE